VVFTLLSICLLRALYFCYSVLNHVYFFLLCDFPLYPFTQRLPTLFSLLKCVSTTLTPFFSITLCALKKARLLFFFTLALKPLFSSFFFVTLPTKKAQKHTQEKLYPSFKSVSPKVETKSVFLHFVAFPFYKTCLFFVVFPPQTHL